MVLQAWHQVKINWCVGFVFHCYLYLYLTNSWTQGFLLARQNLPDSKQVNFYLFQLMILIDDSHKLCEFAYFALLLANSNHLFNFKLRVPTPEGSRIGPHSQNITALAVNHTSYCENTKFLRLLPYVTVALAD